jgi:hypothetical protein
MAGFHSLVSEKQMALMNCFERRGRSTCKCRMHYNAIVLGAVEGRKRGKEDRLTLEMQRPIFQCHHFAVSWM